MATDQALHSSTRSGGFPPLVCPRGNAATPDPLPTHAVRPGSPCCIPSLSTQHHFPFLSPPGTLPAHHHGPRPAPQPGCSPRTVPVLGQSAPGTRETWGPRPLGPQRYLPHQRRRAASVLRLSRRRPLRLPRLQAPPDCASQPPAPGEAGAPRDPRGLQRPSQRCRQQRQRFPAGEATSRPRLPHNHGTAGRSRGSLAPRLGPYAGRDGSGPPRLRFLVSLRRAEEAGRGARALLGAPRHAPPATPNKPPHWLTTRGSEAGGGVSA